MIRVRQTGREREGGREREREGDGWGWQGKMKKARILALKLSDRSFFQIIDLTGILRAPPSSMLNDHILIFNNKL